VNPGGTDPFRPHERALLSRRCVCGGDILRHRDQCDALASLARMVEALRDAFPGTVFAAGFAPGDPRNGTQEMPRPVRVQARWRGGPDPEDARAVLLRIGIQDADLHRRG